MNVLRLALYALCTLVFAGFANASRVAVYEESTILTPPDPSWTIFGGFGVAIDGDSALVSGERHIVDPVLGELHQGAVFLYQRASDAGWNYVGQLGPIAEITEWVRAGLAMKDGVAMTITDQPRIFERTGTTWTQATIGWPPSTALQGPDIEISLGRILAARISCINESVVLIKQGDAWVVDGVLTGHTNSCGDSPPSPFQDIEGNRAVVLNPRGFDSEPAVARVYAKNVPGTGWRPYVSLDYNDGDSVFGPEVSMSAIYTVMTGSRERGTNVIHERNLTYSGSFNTLQPADGWMQPDGFSATSLDRFHFGFVQRNFSADRGAYVVNYFQMNVDDYSTITHIATLQAKGGESLGRRVDTTFNRIIVNGRSNTSSSNKVRIFELPDVYEFLLPQVHDFEQPDSAVVWQQIPGSAFSIVTSGNTHVYRQASTRGDAGAWGPGTWSHNQSIQAEITARSFVGNDRWVGLQTRRSDEANYYYVTLRASGSVQLKRMLNGVYTTLASAPAVVTTGRRYRLRLESIGTAHRVYLDDRPVITAYDDSLSEGNAGLAMYRASADFDNVIVTSDPFTSIYRTDFSDPTPGPASWRNSGDWRNAGGVYRQSSMIGDARSIVGAMTDDQIVQVRVKPTGLGDPKSWVGLLARYEDASNYLYVSLRKNNTVTLRRVQNGAILEMFTAPLTVTAGTWYTIRADVVAGLTRIYINDKLTFTTNENVGPVGPNPGGGWGRVGLVTYKASADYDDFLAYQP